MFIFPSKANFEHRSWKYNFVKSIRPMFSKFRIALILAEIFGDLISSKPRQIAPLLLLLVTSPLQVMLAIGSRRVSAVAAPSTGGKSSSTSTSDACNLTFYADFPKEAIAIDDFEQYAIDRLQGKQPNPCTGPPSFSLFSFPMLDSLCSLYFFPSTSLVRGTHSSLCLSPPLPSCVPHTVPPTLSPSVSHTHKSSATGRCPENTGSHRRRI